MLFNFIVLTSKNYKDYTSWTNIGYLVSSLNKINDLEVDVTFYDYNDNEFDKAI